MTQAMPVADRERTASRLLRISAARSYDPMVAIDWEAPLLDGVFFCSPHRVSLYGTELWERLDHAQRVELSKHEVASIASVGIWFELILMQMLLRHVYDLVPTSRHVQYALTEIADECRHSVMFGRMIEKLGCPAYGVGSYEHQLGRALKAIASGPELFAAALVAEELLDRLQREAMADESIQPLVRAVSRIHVVEEARHVRYAREELARQLEGRSRRRRALSRLLVARSAHVVATRLVHPRAYAAVGLDPRRARRVARANPHHQETLRWAAARLVGFFEELGLIAGPGRLLWRRASLVARGRAWR